MSGRTGRAHSKAGWLSPSEKLRLGEAIRAALSADPSLSLEKLVQQTRAPLDVVMQVRARWRREVAA